MGETIYYCKNIKTRILVKDVINAFSDNEKIKC